MNKTFLLIAAVAAGTVLTSCSSDPSDLRPGQKVSVDQVPPGMRNTANLEGKNRPEHAREHGEMMLNHDPHATQLKHDTTGAHDTHLDHSGHETGKETTNTDSVRNHE